MSLPSYTGFVAGSSCTTCLSEPRTELQLMVPCHLSAFLILLPCSTCLGAIDVAWLDVEAGCSPFRAQGDNLNISVSLDDQPCACAMSCFGRLRVCIPHHTADPSHVSAVLCQPNPPGSTVISRLNCRDVKESSPGCQNLSCLEDVSCPMHCRHQQDSVYKGSCQNTLRKFC